MHGREAIATITPLVTPPMEIATFISKAEIGGIKISTILPCIFAINKEDEVWLKACCKIDIIIKPGARNSIKGTPFMSGLSLPKASVKIAINNIVVAIGAAMV